MQEPLVAMVTGKTKKMINYEGAFGHSVQKPFSFQISKNTSKIYQKIPKLEITSRISNTLLFYSKSSGCKIIATKEAVIQGKAEVYCKGKCRQNHL